MRRRNAQSMFTYLCKLFHHLHSRPRIVLALAVILTLAALFPLKRLETRMSFTDLLPEDFSSVRTWRQIGEKFGGLGHLAIVVHSEDSAANAAAIDFIADHLRNHPDVNFLEYRTEAEFYKAHKLLYISLKDLQEVDKRVETGFWLSKKKRNPLILDLLDEDEKESSFEATSLDDLQRKYFARLQGYLGTPDGKTLVLRVYPDFDVGDIARCRAFYHDVKTVTTQFKESVAGRPDPARPELLFTGDMMRNMQNEGRLYSEIIDSAKRSLYLTALLLLLYFIRIPVGAILSVIPLAMATVWTLAITSKLVGYLSLVTGPLSLLLVGIGLESAVQLLARWREERRKNFSAAVAFETIILETGPAITTGVLVSAAAFLTLMITDFRGFAQFGLMAGIGMLCTLVAVLVVFPCILIIVESYGVLPAMGSRMYNFNLFRSRPYKLWRWHLAALAAFTLFAVHQGIQLKFQFNFDKLTFPNSNLQADSLVQAAGEAIVPPAVVITKDYREAQAVADAVRRMMREDTLSPTVQTVTTMTDLLPADQEEKLAIIAKLKKAVTPALIAGAPGPLGENLEKLRDSWESRKLTPADLPANYKKKFLGKDSLSGQFTFIFPSVNLREGWNNIAFAEDVRDIRTEDGRAWHASGAPVVQADLLELIIPDTRRAFVLAFFTIAFLVLLDVKSVRGTAVLILPLLFSLIWTLGLMKVGGIKLSWYNLVAFPAMLAFGINNGVHLYHRYIEEGRGSLRFVLRRAGETTAVSTLVGMAGFVGLAFSDHRGLASLGQTALIGLGMSLLAPLLIMPLIIGYLEERANLQPEPELKPERANTVK
ncbi:MAG TPA: MMPL family transporter [Fibrobacteria bacterium]|nr:MMPL family transporter [Fibrobacteria bacterium]